jgi:hypothetical protein
MKKLFVFMAMFFTASTIFAQDVITLSNGETISGQVAEVGINEVKYYKSSNLQGPVYIAAKADISQIVYANGSKDVFAINQQQPATVIVQQPAAQTVIVQQQSRKRNNWNSRLFYPLVTAHIDLGHHGGGYFRSYGGGHHGRRHH